MSRKPTPPDLRLWEHDLPTDYNSVRDYDYLNVRKGVWAGTTVKVLFKKRINGYGYVYGDIAGKFVVEEEAAV